jgi:hypothetical protein
MKISITKMSFVSSASAVLFFLPVGSLHAWAQTTVERTDNRVVVSVPMVPATEKPVETGLAEIIRAKFPLAISFGDLGAGWRDINYQGTRYFTKGETAIVSETEYLIAYAYDASAPENQISRAKTSADSGEKEFIASTTGNSVGSSYAPGDRFALTLLSLRLVLPSLSNGSIGLRSFNAAAYRTTSKFNPPLDNAGYRQQLSLVYLGKISEAANAYSNAYLDVMPPMETAFAARQALLPFAGNGYIFNVPGTSQPFKVNSILGEKKRSHLRRRKKTVFYYQDQPAEDGLRAVLLLDGTVLRVDGDAWKRYKKDSEIPD